MIPSKPKRLYNIAMKRIIALGVVIFSVIAIWIGAWFYAGNELRKAIVGLADADGQTAPKITCANLDIAGFPFRFDVTCTGAKLVSEDTTLTLAELRASILVYDPWHILTFAKAPATLADAFTGSRSRLDWTRLEASLHLIGWRLGRLSLDGDNFVYTDTTAASALIGKAGHIDMQGLDMPEIYDKTKGRAGIAIYALARDINAPGLQINDANTSIQADITGLGDDLRTYADPAMLSAWQQAGGKIKLYGFKGDDGTANFEIAGTVGLDDQMRATGQLKVTSKGVVERLGPVISQNMTGLILGNPGPDGTYAQTLNFRAGVVMSGIVPLALIPPLR